MHSVLRSWHCIYRGVFVIARLLPRKSRKEMGRRILAICLIFTTLCTGCAGDRPSLMDRVDQVNSRLVAEGNGSQGVREWFDDHPLVRNTVYVAGFATLLAAAVAVGVLYLTGRLQPSSGRDM